MMVCEGWICLVAIVVAVALMVPMFWLSGKFVDALGWHEHWQLALTSLIFAAAIFGLVVASNVAVAKTIAWLAWG